MLFGIDGDTIEERLEQAIEYMQEAIEEQKETVEHYRKKMKERVNYFNSSYIELDFISSSINDLNRNMKLKEAYEEQLTMLRIIRGAKESK